VATNAPEEEAFRTATGGQGEDAKVTGQDQKATPSVEGGTGADSSVASVNAGGGALLRTVHMTRDVNVYPLQEMEIDALALFNGVATACFSIGSALVTFGAGVLASGIIQGTLTAEASAFVKFASPSTIILGVIFLIGAVIATIQRSNNARKLKNEAKIVQEI
jgi:hypothetical protein